MFTMVSQYRKSLCLLIIVFICTYASASPIDVVSQFGQYLSSWCNTDDIQYRDKIEYLCSGVKSCRVEDKIHADYQRKRGYMDNETYFLDSYLNMFQTMISSGVRFNLSNIVVETQDTYPDGQTLTFITADVKVSGKINYNVKDLFLVRDNKISGIYTYSSKYGLKHLNGKLISALQDGQYTLSSDYMGFSKFGTILLKNRYNKEGLLDLKGNIIVPFIWDSVLYLNGEFAKCENREGETFIYDVRLGKLTPFSNVISLEQSSKLFSNGMAIVQDSKTKKWGYLKETDYGYSNVNYCYDYPLSYFDENGLAHVTISGISAIIDNNFNIVIHDNDRYEVEYAIGDNLFKVRSKTTNNVGAINSDYKEIIPCKYDWVYGNTEGMIKVMIDGKFGFVDKFGRTIVPCIYDEEDLGTMSIFLNDPYDFHNGYCLVGNRDIPSKDFFYNNISHAFIDKSGNIVLPYNYTYECDPYTAYIDYCKDWGKYYTIVTRSDGKKSFIDINGNSIKGIAWYDDLYYECDGMIEYAIGGKYGFLNTQGEIVMQPTYNSIFRYQNGYYSVRKRINSSDKYGLLDSEGTIVVPCIYDNEIELYNGIAIVEKDGILGLVDLYGNAYFCE